MHGRHGRYSLHAITKLLDESSVSAIHIDVLLHISDREKRLDNRVRAPGCFEYRDICSCLVIVRDPMIRSKVSQLLLGELVGVYIPDCL